MTFNNNHNSKSISIGFSPCPNDTFIFDAIVNHKVDTEGLTFEVVMEDVETLNQKALRGELAVTKISFAAFVLVAGNYQLLNSGSALGRGAGPLLIHDQRSSDFIMANADKLIFAIPGKHTTANFLFSIFFPEAVNKKEFIFSEIENAVLSGRVDAGVIIHENRFTYEAKGLKKISDLGELWEKETHLPVPLGGIAIKKELPEELKMKVDRVIRRSVEFAFANPGSSEEYVKNHAQEMSHEVRKKHIDTYVNAFSADLGETGKDSIGLLFQKAINAGLVRSMPADLFVRQMNVNV